jgi:general secretion pathway protein H
MSSIRSRGTGPRFSQSGFTLIELIVVLAIISLVLAVVVPNLGQGSGRHMVAATAHEVAAMLRLSRNRAIAENQPTRFIVDNGSYGIGDDRHLGHVPQDISMMFFDGERTDATLLAGAIRFYPDGSSTGGGVALSTAKVRYAVFVDWLNGNVSIQTQSAPSHR